ncbi:MAG: bifunctional UDP-N-acetylglucosamine diphosphorylase/glucosamine-1-phosphate N-acetyltransferase GlmU [Bdellovibrionota bacterium]
MKQHQRVIILAAGKGKRMKSSLPKVLHEISGQPMITHILKCVSETIPNASVALVVGHEREKVEAAVRGSEYCAGMDITFITQNEQKGTGHATKRVIESAWGESLLSSRSAVLILPGDVPLISNKLIREMITPLRRGEVLRLLTCEFTDPTGYGRVVRRGKSGAVCRIVEEKDATSREKLINETAVSIYYIQAQFLRFALDRLCDDNSQQEYYLTDILSQAVRTKRKIDVLKWSCAEDLHGINDLWELTKANRVMNDRYLRALAISGVRFVDPTSTWVDVTVKINEDVTVYPGAILKGKSGIGRGVIIGPNVLLRDVQVSAEANIKAGTVAEQSTIGEHSQVGPYAHLRPGSSVGAGAKIGNFVELKKAVVGENSSIAHLSYLGDADIGKNVNIGCGFVTCNFDGRTVAGERKHKTVIEDNVFMGSDCQVVAPVRIGRGAYIASGSTITSDVEADALAIARSRQVVKPGYAKKLRDGEGKDKI